MGKNAPWQRKANGRYRYLNEITNPETRKQYKTVAFIGSVSEQKRHGDDERKDRRYIIFS